jgi:peroxiredoxin
MIITLAVTMAACNWGNKHIISGEIDNGEGKTLFLERMDLKQNVIIDSVKLGKDGRFQFKGERLPESTFFRLRFDNKNFITLLADSTEHIEVIADATHMEDSYTVKNSLGSNYIKILNRKLKITQQTLDSLSSFYSTIAAEDKVRKTMIEREYVEALNDHKKFVGSFVMQNPRSFASYYALFQEMKDGNMIMNVFDKNDQVYFSTLATSLNLFYPESERVKHLYQYVLQIKTIQKREQNIQDLISNAQTGIPDINEATPQGNKVNLRSLDGKIVLLSFWASWDAASRKENKNLKRLYDKYKAKGFEIYQVSLDQSKILWENAIEQDQCTWINVSDLQMNNAPAARAYNIRSIPANYLISRDGEIIGKDLFGAMLEEKLGKLF